jgi:hypothetical protein
VGASTWGAGERKIVGEAKRGRCKTRVKSESWQALPLTERSLRLITLKKSLKALVGILTLIPLRESGLFYLITLADKSTILLVGGSCSDRHIIRGYVLGRMTEQNGVSNAAERENDENGNHAGPFHHPPQVLRHHPNIDRPPTSANGLNLEKAGRPRGFKIFKMSAKLPLRVLVMLFKLEGETL